MKFTKLVKKITTGMLVITLSIASYSGSTTQAAEGHIVPTTGENSVIRYCTNIYRVYSHTAYCTSAWQNRHLISGGTYCEITGLLYHHKVTCSVCGAHINDKTYMCTTVHSKCGTRIVDHPAY